MAKTSLHTHTAVACLPGVSQTFLFIAATFLLCQVVNVFLLVRNVR